MVDNVGNWRWSLFDQFLMLFVLLHIAAKKGPILALVNDVVVWTIGAGHRFSLKSAYEIRTGHSNVAHETVWQAVHKYRGVHE
ncbi:hypothetical protein V6N12_002623 [Hibiscus sabdariffa]|uniref:Uncharacterized protein n=1 Tax=Hibiscus sabdariffa TaxID=183260 RepID=A0ABR2E9W9_9ROSI